MDKKVADGTRITNSKGGSEAALPKTPNPVVKGSDPLAPKPRSIR